MRALAVLSLHTSPLAQPGTGDGGGMNVYVRELSAALARSGVRCEVFTRADDPRRPAVVSVEPGFRVHHIPAGPLGPVAKEQLPDLVAEWTAGVRVRLDQLAVGGLPGGPVEVDAIHANYWLSGVAGHSLKHQLDVPLVVTFHTLDRVKAAALAGGEPERRSRAEAEVVGCSDAVLASCPVEADQLVDLYGADRERVAIVPPGVDHAFFAPGDRAQARRASGWPDPETPVVLFAGRIQPLKGLTIAVKALSMLDRVAASDRLDRGRLQRAQLMVIGGPSGPEGPAELHRVQAAIAAGGLADRVRLLPPQPHELLSTSYRAADVCVVPSSSESFGLVALEAGACGIPVVASAVGGLTTLVDDGRTGYLVDSREPAEFASRLAAVIGDPVRAAQMGRASAASAGQYTWTAAAAALRHCCESLTARQLVACR